jgi:hypothetical protein
MNKNQTEIKEMLPDQGQLVEVRHRRWLATEINKTHLVLSQDLMHGYGL